ncbi:hypothetical protein F2Q68_00025094 [Brassica cretica]|uniref:S1 motif domain-containing protein n=2 Tax=Brassica cretica TaxID=69181 RepID=A0ABQ7DMT1_BRACR|nr:hypothetical protein F2Q68_00025094 [Brassica cretica]KAF3578650.1 hypothetical protein DY000_02030544 [Brassica cretica]
MVVHLIELLLWTSEFLYNVIEIKDISCDAEVGKLYECTVKSILEEGLVIEYNGGRHGLLHISELSTEEVSKVSYVLSVGEHITLKCIKKNFSSITQFSLKAVA